ncbi:MAG: M48 family metallopeptidase [Bacteroidota bacterium]
MVKIAGQFIVLAVLFFGIWFLLGSFDYLGYFRVEELTKGTEQKLGELILEELQKGGEELNSDTVYTFVNGIKNRLCTANGINDSSITLHILVRNEVNAIALPDRHLIVYTGMIRYCKSPEELSGVLAHEIAHIEHGDIMKGLKKEAGLSMLAALAEGEANGEIARETARLISSTAFDRRLESEADASAVHIMAKAEIDPVSFADVIFRLSQEKNNTPKQFEWISTHPNSQDRYSEILRLRKLEVYHTMPIADSTAWAYYKKIIRRKPVALK